MKPALTVLGAFLLTACPTETPQQAPGGIQAVDLQIYRGDQPGRAPLADHSALSADIPLRITYRAVGHPFGAILAWEGGTTFRLLHPPSLDRTATLTTTGDVALPQLIHPRAGAEQLSVLLIAHRQPIDLPALLASEAIPGEQPFQGLEIPEGALSLQRDLRLGPPSVGQ